MTAEAQKAAEYFDIIPAARRSGACVTGGAELIGKLAAFRLGVHQELDAKPHRSSRGPKDAANSAAR